MQCSPVLRCGKLPAHTMLLPSCGTLRKPGTGMKLIALAAVSTIIASTLFVRVLPAQNYVPGMGEIMGAQQMRHTKLWFAGQAGNWPLANYELGEIREGFEDAVAYHPVFKGIPVSVLLRRYTAKPLASLGAAIHAKDSTRFKTAFDQLTHACNSCHRAAAHAYIVIRRPSTSPFTDQDFSIRSP